MPTTNVHLQFHAWAEEYGPIYSLMLGSKCLIVLSSDQAIKDLLDRRSAIYSDRMDMFTGHRLLSGGFRILTMVRNTEMLKIGDYADEALIAIWNEVENGKATYHHTCRLMLTGN